MELAKHSSEDDGRKKGTHVGRKHSRHEVEEPIQLLILVPEDTLRTPILDGKTLDISAGGMKLSVHDLPKHIYKKLILKTREVVIEFPASEGREEFEVLGQLVWYGYQKPDVNATSAPCMMGVKFKPEQYKVLEAYLEILKQARGEA